jgi:glycosyltransferase involved in cell wall biosynthesis
MFMRAKPERVTPRRTRRRRVVIVQRKLPDYRVALFERLRDQLNGSQIDLDVLYSDRYDALRGVSTVPATWMTRVSGREVSLGARRALWQAIQGPTMQADLIILEFSMRYLANHLVLARRRIGRRRVAAWGHGTNLLRDEGASERAMRAWVSRRVDWWFAYNERSAESVAQMNYPRSRITVVNNAIDTEAVARERATLPREAVNRVRASLRLGAGHVGIFCGGLYPEKRIPFLAQASRRVRQVLAGFQLIIVGDGTDRPVAERLDAEEEWVHYVGRQEGAARVPYFACADVTLMPGLVGLGVLDAFALGCPPVATRFPHHAPEVEYLTHEKNGLLANDSPQAFAEQIIRALSKPLLRDRLIRGCKSAARHYTLTRMVERFGGGIEQALAAPPEPLGIR